MSDHCLLCQFLTTEALLHLELFAPYCKNMSMQEHNIARSQRQKDIGATSVTLVFLNHRMLRYGHTYLSGWTLCLLPTELLINDQDCIEVEES